MAHGGQIIVPVDIAQRFVEHCTGAPGLTEEGLAASVNGPTTPQAQRSLPHDVFRVHNNPLCDGDEAALPSPGSGRLPLLGLRISRLSTLSAQDPRWLQGLSRNNSALPGVPACSAAACRCSA